MEKLGRRVCLTACLIEVKWFHGPRILTVVLFFFFSYFFSVLLPLVLFCSIRFILISCMEVVASICLCSVAGVTLSSCAGTVSLNSRARSIPHGKNRKSTKMTRDECL